MTTPIPAQFLAEQITTRIITIDYKVDMGETPTPADIVVVVNSVIGSGPQGHTNNVLEIPYNDLPAGAQNAISQLYQFCETEHAAEFTP